MHLDFQSSNSATKHVDLAVYNALLHRQYLVPVHSLIVLLRPKADHPNLHGLVTYAPRPDRGKMDFRYEVVRLWERPVEELLEGDVGALPLATLGKLPAGIDLDTGLAAIVARIIDRLNRETAPDQMRHLLTASFLLTGLRVSNDKAREYFHGVRAMRDSATFIAILEEGREEGRQEGRLEELKAMILRLGRKLLGEPGGEIRAHLDSVTNVGRLELLLEGIVDVKSWRDLLASV
ncbi:MAG: hypothetical protein FJ303_12475 [Planctomycetes bacterium]|nr:hypothetical protein [Planctomycetota bacterium]